MVFSKSEEEHVTHVSTALARLRANTLFAKASKRLFHIASVEYLGYVVSPEGLKLDQAKVQKILNWPTPRNLKALQSFLSFSNFYSCFINNYSKKISSLKIFLKKDSRFPLNEEALRQFHQLKEAFTIAPIFLTLILFYPQLFSLAEPFSEFHFSITYPPGRLETLPDELSHWDDVFPERGEDFISKNPMNYQKIIKKDEIQASKFFAVKVEEFSNLIDSIQKALWQDSQYRSILQDLGKGKSVQDYSLDSSSQLLLFKDWVVVPNDPTIQLSILQRRHEPPLAGHPGQEKTLKLVKRDLHWPGMTQFIKGLCNILSTVLKKQKYSQQEVWTPQTSSNSKWSLDFITQLPLSNSFDSILFIVERFSKMAVFIPTMSSITSLGLAHLFIKNMFSKHGLPSSIVSDRGSLLVSSFWTNLCQQINISRDLSTAYHPETDGQTEKVNQILEKYLLMYVSYHQDDWNTWLPLAELDYNASDHSSTKQSPFFTVYGRDPHFDSVHITQDTPAGKLSTKFQSVQQDVKIEIEVAINSFKRTSNQLDPPENCERWLGPFPTLKKVGTRAYHLKLSSQWKSIHPVFHISLLETVKKSTIPNRHQEPPPPIIIEEKGQWEVSQILDSKLMRGKLWYLVEWKGFSQDSERSIWEPTENLKNRPELVRDFHSFYPDKQGPNYSRA
ncbi:hypothetical protein O181_067855 [Austropuccinia psidii MF-1]|uniref:Chromo domain-containing protein n=1 Tax=Austropuccinia psidii MF-1 TaxID=1389203 RepID=A0A9Q3EZW2_9BASI|nr:hypothetical protein [Austropuccinia psidii MF-1]